MSDPTTPRPADGHPPPGVDQPQETDPPDLDLLLAVLVVLLRDIERGEVEPERVPPIRRAVARLMAHRRGER